MTQHEVSIIENTVKLTQDGMKMRAYIEQLEAENEALRANVSDLRHSLRNVQRLHHEKCADYTKLYKRYLAAGHNQSLFGEMLDTALPSILCGIKIAGAMFALMAVVHVVGNLI